MKRLCVLGFGLLVSAILTGCCCSPCCSPCGWGGGGCGPGGCPAPVGVSYAPSCASGTCAY